MLNFIYMKTEMLHAIFIDVERFNLMNKFNNSDDFLLMLIIMYQMSTQNVNLDRACSKMIVAISTINVSIEIQA